MNKKAVLGKITHIILLVMVLLVVMFWLLPTFQDLRAAIGRAKDEVVLPGDEQYIVKAGIAGLKDGMNALIEAFKYARDAPIEGGCIVIPNTMLPKDFKGHYIEITTISEGTSFVIKNEAGQMVTERAYLVERVFPCVVYGKLNGESAPENFYDNWLDGTKCTYPNCKKDYIERDIYIPKQRKIEFDGATHDREDIFYLYKPDRNHVCFFATRDGGSKCRAKSTGLDDNCAYPVAYNLPVCRAITTT